MHQKPSESPFSDTSARRQEAARPRQRDRQFSLSRVLLILTVATAATAPLAYLARALRGSRQSLFVFILFCLIAPPLLLICAITTHALVGWFQRIRNR